MLFNLGWTADAAAAHENVNDLVASPSDSRLSCPLSHPPPVISFPTLSSLGLRELYSRYKGTESSRPHQGPLRTMSLTPVGSRSSSDGDYSIVTPIPDQSRVARSQSARKQPSRPKTIYQLAHPATHARHRRLKLRPKLLLQLQRVSQTTRPIPILDVLPSTVSLTRLARKTIFRGKRRLGPNDLIIVKSDLYEPAGGDIADKYLSADEENDDHREAVATICQILKDGASSQGKAEICLSSGPTWEAIPLPNGSYEFRANTDQGVQVLRWVSRAGKHRRVSAPPGSTLQEDTKRFTFSVINPNTRRHPVIATMSRNVLEVFDEYSLPSPSGDTATSPTCGMSVISDSSEMDAPLDRVAIKTNDSLRTIIIITAVWVALREGWSQNFTYNDTALTLTPRAICSPTASRHSSPTAVKTADDLLSGTYPDGPSLSSINHRLSVSSALPSQSSTSSEEHARSMRYASLPQRSRSTGQAFIERPSRRSVSGLENRPSRHSTFPATLESDWGETKESRSSRGTSSQSKVNVRDFGAPDRAIDKSGEPNGRSRASTDQGGKSVETRAGLDSAPSKGKRRHRLSGFFDFFTRKSGHHETKTGALA